MAIAIPASFIVGAALGALMYWAYVEVAHKYTSGVSVRFVRWRPDDGWGRIRDAGRWRTRDVMRDLGSPSATRLEFGAIAYMAGIVSGMGLWLFFRLF